jgi:hypothetical protein
MIFARGIQADKRLAFSARDAARRLAPSRANARGRRYPWRPIVLRWRRGSKRLVNAPAGRAVRRTTFLWDPQFHFHFAAYVYDRTRRDRFAGFLAAADVRPARVLLDSRCARARVVAPLVEPRRTYFQRRAQGAPNRSWPGGPTRMPAAQNLSWMRAPHPVIIPWAARPQHAPVWTRIPDRARARARQQQLTQGFSRRLPTRQSWLQVLLQFAPIPGDHFPRRSLDGNRVQLSFDRSPELARRRGLRSATITADNECHQQRSDLMLGAHRSPESNRFQRRFDHAEELVWRRGLPPRSELAESGGQQEHAESSTRPPVRSVPRQDASLAVASVLERARAPQMTKFDPVVLDRLTDDVIRRVEQRMRIERQRRGL